MPSVKVTKLLEVLDATVAELKAGDPNWTPAQRKAAKDAAEVFKTFRLLSAQQCSDRRADHSPGRSLCSPPALPATKKTAQEEVEKAVATLLTTRHATASSAVAAFCIR